VFGGLHVGPQNPIFLVVFLTQLRLITIILKTSRSQWPRGLRRRSAVARLPRLRVRMPPEACLSVCCECCVLSGKRSLRRTDHSSRGVLPTVVRRCVCSRNLMSEEAMARVGPQRHGRKIHTLQTKSKPSSTTHTISI